MPNYIKVPSGPLQLRFLGHDSVSDYDLDAGEPGACLAYADRWHVHRSTIPEFDEKFAPWVEKFTGIPRLIDTKRTEQARKRSLNPDKVSAVEETFPTYMNRVFAKVPKAIQDAIQAEAEKVSSEMKISAAPAERIAPIELCYFKRADSILSTDLDTINAKVSNFLALCSDYQLVRERDDKPNRESLARLLQQFEAARFALED